MLALKLGGTWEQGLRELRQLEPKPLSYWQNGKHADVHATSSFRKVLTGDAEIQRKARKRGWKYLVGRSQPL